MLCTPAVLAKKPGRRKGEHRPETTGRQSHFGSEGHEKARRGCPGALLLTFADLPTKIYDPCEAQNAGSRLRSVQSVGDLLQTVLEDRSLKILS